MVSASRRLLKQHANLVLLLTAGECSADRKEAIARTKIPTLSLHFLCREQSYHRASYQHDVTGWLEDGSLQKVRHLQVYQTTEAQIFSSGPTTAAVKASFQSHLSHFSLLSSGANPHPHPPHAERRLLSSGVEGGREVMSGLPLGGISLIKMK